MTTTRNEPSFIGSLFGSKPSSVDAVMETFNKTIADLEAVELAHRGQAATHAETIAKATAAQNAAVTEADRAASIAGRMKAIFA